MWEDQMRRGNGKGVREGIWGETAKIKGPLRGSMDTKHSRDFLKYMHICR